MIRTVVAYTYEMVDAELAVAEILQQLDLDSTKLANAVGIITCFPVFIETGVVKALSDALPFEIVGATTLGNSVHDSIGSIMPMLSIMILTSDEASFLTAHTAPIEELNAGSLFDISASNALHVDKKLGMAMVFTTQPPVTSHVADLIEHLQKSIGNNVPLFGMVACDPEMDKPAATIFQGAAMYNKAALLLIYGDIKPTFLTVSISNAYIKKQQAIITRAEGNILQELDDMPFKQYLQSLGLDETDTLQVVPIVIDYRKGTKPITRFISHLTPEGWAVCGGDVPVNGTVSIAMLESEDILNTATSLAEQLHALPDFKGAFIISCLGRNLALGNDVALELEAIHAVLGDSVPYMGCYSMGEIAPLQDQEGNFINFLHNYSIIACTF